MRRREFIALIGAIVAWPFAAMAQEPGRTYRLGAVSSSPRNTPNFVAMFDELRRLGFIMGRNLTVDWRSYGPRIDLIPQFVADLVKGQVDVILGRVDGFDQDEAESKRDERAVIVRRLLASKCDTLEAFELADRLFDACPCLVECFRKEGGHILGVGSIRDCRTYSALARGVAI